MEASVLNLQMMEDVNGNSKVQNAELEVKKLQELVRKLERQNEQLRTRANAANNCTSASHLFTPACVVGSAAGPTFLSGNYFVTSTGPTSSCLRANGPYASDGHFSYFQPQSASDAEERDTELTVLDEVEILDLDSILPIGGDCEQSWLYVSPKEHLFPQASITPLQWCRHVLDHPRPEVEMAKRSLCNRLDQGRRWHGVFSGSVSSTPLYSHVEEPPPMTNTIKPFTKPALTEQPVPPSPSSHVLPQPNGRNCFSLTEKSPSFLYHSPANNYSVRRPPLSTQSSMDSELGVSELEEDSISLGYKLQDMTDVEVMARLQEESLRQDYATTSSMLTRRYSSSSFHSGLSRAGYSQPHLPEEEEEGEGGDGYAPPPPQSRLLRSGSMQRSLSQSQGLASLRDWRRAPPLAPLTPPGLAHQQQLHSPGPAGCSPETQRPTADKLRRSMPNLMRAPSIPNVPSIPAVSAVPGIPSPAGHSASPSSLRNSLSFDSSSGLARLQSAIPSPGQLQQRVQSVGNFSMATRPPLKATAYVSPTIQAPSAMPTSTSLHSTPVSSIPLPNKPGLPQASTRSCLPRPASIAGAGLTPRSKLAQPPRSLLMTPKSISALNALRDGSWKDGCY